MLFRLHRQGNGHHVPLFLRIFFVNDIKLSIYTILEYL